MKIDIPELALVVLIGATGAPPSARRSFPAAVAKPLSESKPWSIAVRVTVSAAVCAAKGVLLRDPLNPIVPPLDQLTTFPWVSVIVTIVLLKVAWIWATP